MDDAALGRFGRSVSLFGRIVESALGDLSSTGYRVLALIAHGDERSSQIAGRLAVARPTISAAVESLVAQGYVVRSPEPGDRRAFRLELTDAGRRALAEADVAVAARLRPIMERAEEADAALAGMDALRRALLPRPTDAEP